ncbi:MAG: MBL fold metallo-hydrolase [Parasphingorhabdus sp.]
MKPSRSFLIAFLATMALTACGMGGPPKAPNPFAEDRIVFDEDDLSVTVLGSGMPLPSPSQSGAAILVQAGKHKMMFDCGRGCTTRLAQVNPELITQVDKLFVTHMHSDHLTGIPDLWLNGWTQGRNIPMQIWGPEGTTEMMEALRTAFARDINFRVSDGVPANDDGLGPTFTDLPKEDGVVFEEGEVKVTAFLVDHSSIKPAYGYRIDYGEHSVLISGDTTVTPALAKYGQGTDVILLEVMPPLALKMMGKRFGKEQSETVTAYHLTAQQAAAVFKETQPELGVYYHYMNIPPMAKSVREESEQIYDGEMLLSKDLSQIVISAEGVTHNGGVGESDRKGEK